MNPDQEPMNGTAASFRTLWIRELWMTWFLLLLIATAPAVLFGTALFAACALMYSVFIGVPVFVMQQAKPNNDRMKSARKLAVLFVVPIATLVFVFKVDATIPVNATPIVQAMEAFKADTGQYPATVDELMPKYLPELPILKMVWIQPQVRYALRDGAPILSIPSSAGDAFAEYEYDFVNKTWIHHS